MADHIVLLIDLHPLTHLTDPTPYLNSILATSKSLLLSASLSSSLSTFKLFFSSLSPTLSAHTLSYTPILSFSPADQTLIALSQTFDSFSSPRIAISPPRASYVAGSMLKIVGDHNWEKKSKGQSGNLLKIRSNLVLLFSPIGDLANCANEFMNDDESEDGEGKFLGNLESFRDKFCNIFRSVNEVYIRRDIHCSWIDVEFHCEKNDSSSQLQLLKNGIRSLGWGFCSTNSIVLGSSLIPVNLIYPLFGVTSSYLGLIDNCKPIHTKLTIGISDAGGEPLERNYCDIDLFYLKDPQKKTVCHGTSTLKLKNSEKEALNRDKGILSRFDGGIAKIQIKSVNKCNSDEKYNFSSGIIFVRRHYSKESRNKIGEISSDFFADKVLEAVSNEICEFVSSENGPTWQLILSFLSRNGYKALVSIVSEKGDSFMAILKPFTVHLALLEIVNDGYIMETEYYLPKISNVDGKLTKSETSPSKNSLSSADKNKNRKKKNLYKDLNWILFRKAAFEFTALELEAAYFGSKFGVSKRLKLFQSWMKQVNKSNSCCFTLQDNAEPCKQIEIEKGIRLLNTEEDSQPPNPSSFPTEPSRIQDLALVVSSPDTSETFFENLPKKIQDGLESKGVDLQNFAERLVNLSIYWLFQKNYTCNDSMEKEDSKMMPDEFHGNIVADLAKILLKDPKELKDKAKDNGSLILASDSNVGSSSENLVREHELQIFLRMEILRSKISSSIEAKTRRRFVKQICALLEIIQYLVEGGFHGDITLYGYVEKTIKSRYFHVLEGVINKIFVRMDLLPIGEENLSPIFIINSEDSSHSWRDIARNESNGIYESSSGENDSIKTEVDYLQEDISKDENSRKVSGVQGRREKASRYLQRVWAPKQAKGMMVNSEAMRKQSKRKERSKRKDVVCETPSFDMKRDTSDRFVSVSKALFQDD